MTFGEHIAIQGAAALYTLTKCAIAIIFWALDR